MNRFRKGFETQKQIISLDDLAVRGTIPTWLEGTYIRNGAAQFELEKERYWHWFDGLAMLHRYTFKEGRVAFANRFIENHNYQADTKSQTLNFRMPATDPKRSLWEKLSSPFLMKFTDNCNINTVEIDGEYLALTERIEAFSFDLQSLKTNGEFRYENSIGKLMATGHPHYEPQSRHIYNYMLKFGLPSSYQFYRTKGRKHELICKIPTWNPSYMHSFGMTENYLILTEYPMRMPPMVLLQFMFTDTPFFNSFIWNPQQGTRMTVIHKLTGAIVKQVETDAFFAWHHINAFEQGHEIFVDIAAYADWTIIQSLYLDSLRSENQFSTMMSEYRRYRISLDSNKNYADYEPIQSDVRMELPQINYNHYNAKPYRYAYGLSIHNNQRDFVNQIVKMDTEQACITAAWHIDGHYPSESVFAPHPNAQAEDDGVLMSTVLDSFNDSSYLLVLDAQSLETIATAELPFHLPFSFHGRWYANGSMYAL